MFANEDEGFQELCDRLLAYSSTKQSITVSESKKTTRKDDPMEQRKVGKGKKGSSGKGKGSKGQNNTSNVVCWNSAQVRPLRERLSTKVETGQRLVSNMCARLRAC